MIKTMKLVNEESRTCPCCGESHAVQECIVARRVAAPGFYGEVPGRYFYCANADEYFEDHECAAFNAAQGGGPNVTFGFSGMPPFAAGPMPNAPTPQQVEEMMRRANENERNSDAAAKAV